LAAGEIFACAVANGSLCCWGTAHPGSADKTPVVVETPAPFDVIDSKGFGICGLSDGRAYCSTVSQGAFARLDDSSDWSRIAIFDTHICGLRGSNLYCGRGADLAQVGAGLSWTWVDVGPGRACGLASGSLYCWWEDEDPSPVGSATDWTALAMGTDVVCGIRAGEIHCFGDNYDGQLGIGDLTILVSEEPLPIALDGPWQEVRTSHGTTCGVRSGDIYCWGVNYMGSAGVDAENSVVASPSRVGTLSDWHSVSVGQVHGCAMREGGVSCWGTNDGNQLGTSLPDRDPHPEPVPVVLQGD
jgi:alpha-tubulin suppressor-like RCC1 family protein